MKLKLLHETPPWDWPEDAGKTFLGVLRNPQAEASERLLAAELAGDLCAINDSLVDALLAIVASAAEAEDLRAKAAISLGPALEEADLDEFDEPDAVPISEKAFRNIKQSLRKVYLDSSVPKLVRRRVLEAAVRAPEEWHAGAIRSAWSGEDPEWRLTAAFCMNYIRGFEKQILEALESPDPGIRLEAVGAAGNWDVKGAWPHVAALLTAEGTPKPFLLAAIEAAATLNPDEAVPILIDLSGSTDEDIAEAASEALSMAEGSSDDHFDEFDDDPDDEDEPGSGNRETIH